MRLDSLFALGLLLFSSFCALSASKDLEAISLVFDVAMLLSESKFAKLCIFLCWVTNWHVRPSKFGLLRSNDAPMIGDPGQDCMLEQSFQRCNIELPEHSPEYM